MTKIIKENETLFAGKERHERKSEKKRERKDDGSIMMESSPNSPGSRVSFSSRIFVGEERRALASSSEAESEGDRQRETKWRGRRGRYRKWEDQKLPRRARENQSVRPSVRPRLFFLLSTFHHSSALPTGINNGLPLLPWQLSKR